MFFFFFLLFQKLIVLYIISSLLPQLIDLKSSTSFYPSLLPLLIINPQSKLTILKAIYVPADDLTDPAPATTFAHLDATTVLSRAIAELGIYPAVDPLDSTSRIMDPNVIGVEHYNIARGVQKILQVSNVICLVLPLHQ